MSTHSSFRSFRRRIAGPSGRRGWLVWMTVLFAGCANGPADVVFVNAVRLPHTYASPVTSEIFDATRPFDHPAVQRFAVCTLRMDETTALTPDVAGGLFDVRVPDNVDNANLQVALTDAGGGSCSYGQRVLKMDIRLNPGLRLMTPTTAAFATLLVDGDGIFSAASPYVLFTLERVDPGPSVARSRGVFKLLAPSPDGTSSLLAEASFYLRSFQYNPTFVP